MMPVLGLLRSRRASVALILWELAGGDGALAQSTCKVAHLTASDPGVYDSLGIATAMSGETALAGSFWDDDNGGDSGSAYLFAFNGTAWVQTQKLLASDGHNGDWFGWSVAIDGDTAMVGALGHVHFQAPGNGSVYVFRFNGTNWVPQQELLAADGQFDDKFCWSIAISGDVAFIGAPNERQRTRLRLRVRVPFQPRQPAMVPAAEADGFRRSPGRRFRTCRRRIR